MIDGIKAILSDNLSEVRNNPLLDFQLQSKTSLRTGEIIHKKYPGAEYKGLTFIDKGTIIEIRGSIHVLRNQGQHNHNKFGLSEIHYAISELANDLKILCQNAKLTNLEFGVNLDIDFEPRRFLNSLILHKNKKFTNQTGRRMHYKECSHGQYFIKIYDKGLQYMLGEFILRIELKFVKMEKINRLGIKYISDLLDPEKLDKLKKLLLKVYDEILIADLDVDAAGLSDKDKLLYAKGQNDNYWDSILPRAFEYKEGRADKAYMRYVKSYQRKMNRFRKILTLTGADQKQKEIRERIISECDSLLDRTRKSMADQKKGPELTNPLCMAKQSVSRNDCNKLPDKVSQNDSLFYSDKIVQSNKVKGRRCLVTELDISMQKEDSKFICSAGIKFYKKTNPEVWQTLRQRLSQRWQDSPEDKLIEEIHHSIRNEYFNKIHNTRRSIRKVLDEPALFDQRSLIRPDKLEIAGLTN